MLGFIALPTRGLGVFAISDYYALLISFGQVILLLIEVMLGLFFLSLLI